MNLIFSLVHLCPDMIMSHLEHQLVSLIINANTWQKQFEIHWMCVGLLKKM